MTGDEVRLDRRHMVSNIGSVPFDVGCRALRAFFYIHAINRNALRMDVKLR